MIVSCETGAVHKKGPVREADLAGTLDVLSVGNGAKFDPTMIRDARQQLLNQFTPGRGV